jgi:ribosomal protein S18 acetylase RimI-like enzyme
MRIRTFRLEDLDSAAALWQAAEGMSVPPHDEVLRKLERDPQLFLVAEDDRVVGVVMGSYDGRRGWIYRLAVDPDHRRSRVGSLLVGELERRFREMDVTEIRLLTYEDNVSARAFWSEHGYDGLEAVVLYSKSLDGAGAEPC